MKGIFISLFFILIGLAFILLSVYLFPSDAYEIQAPFKASGKQIKGAKVIRKTKDKVSYFTTSRGGKRKHTYKEYIVTVRLPKGRTTRIKHLVLEADYERLDIGDKVTITYLKDAKARKALPDGPHYLLTRSVKAGTFELLGWAIGRPTPSILFMGAVPAILFLGIGITTLVIFIRYKDEDEESLGRS